MQDVDSSTGHQQVQVMWGTDINAMELIHKFRSFITEFVITELDEEEKAERIYTGIPNFYVRQLKQMSEDDIYVLNLNCDHLLQFNQ